VELQLIKPQELTRVIVDSTVQHKAIAHRQRTPGSI
jgi:IS5 family transposase